MFNPNLNPFDMETINEMITRAAANSKTVKIGELAAENGKPVPKYISTEFMQAADHPDLVMPIEEMITRIDFEAGLLDGKPYLTLPQWFNDGRQFTQTCWNRKRKIKHDRAKMNYLINKLAANIGLIDNAMLVDKRYAQGSSRYLLLEVSGGKLMEPNPILRKWNAQGLISLQPVLSILKTQYA